jgi:abortive infection bacteriophage resistance protein
MQKRTYTKQPLSFKKQVELLKSRGLSIPNEHNAIESLQQISYYRLSAYFLPYQSAKDQFDSGVTFKQILDTYSFDRELRLLAFDCIERIEVAIRTQIIYCMSFHHNDAHWHDKAQYFIQPYTNKIGTLVDPYQDLQNIIEKALNARKPEVFIKHYQDNYDTPTNPPSWMCLELLTIGELSNLYKGLRDKADQKRIADFFGLPQQVFASWMHTLAYVRNICAHHSRLWNRDLAIEPMKLKSPRFPWISNQFQNSKRTFYFICLLKYLLTKANPTNQLARELDQLFNKYPNVPIKYLGIPSDGNGTLQDWKREPIWLT